MPQVVPPSSAAAALQLPAGIEIFRAGRHTDDAGREHQFTEADLAGMAASYDPAVREAPLCVGHPADNLPAYGWVKSVGRNAAGALTIDAHQVDPQFAEMVAAGRFKKRSASFYPPRSPANPTPGQWHLRHVAFLGAQPPAIAGLKEIQFAEGDAAGSAVSFSHPIHPVHRQEGESMTEQELQALKAELAAANEARAQAEARASQARTEADAAKAQATQFAEQARADRKAGFVSFAQAQVLGGRLWPKDQAMLVASLEALADCAPVEFSEGGTTTKVSHGQWLQDFVAKGAKVISFGEFAGGPAQGPGSARGKSDADIDQAARAYALHHQVDYAEALTAVTTSFTA